MVQHEISPCSFLEEDTSGTEKVVAAGQLLSEKGVSDVFPVMTIS